MLKNIAVILSISLLSSVACEKSQIQVNDVSMTNVAANSSPETAAPENAGEKVVEKTVADNSNAQTFRGMINGTSFQMKLVREGSKLSGTYFYTKVGKNLNISGTIAADGKFDLKETDAGGRVTGEWSGTWKDEPDANGIQLEGDWKSPGQSSPKFNFYATQQMIEFSGGAKFVNKTIKEENKEKRSEISSIYPELIGINSAAAKDFNELVKKRVVEMNDGYRKDLASMSLEDIKSLPGEITLSNDVSYDVILANNELISLSLSDYTYTGGAHGGTSSFPINYDLKNNRELQLADIFEPNADYLKTISDYAIANLKKNVGEMSDDKWISEGAAPKAENYRSWNLTKKGVMVIFDQYQVAAYAAGPQQLIVPYEKLQSVLRKDGAAASLAK
jgi:hypothetical protein